MYQIGLKDLGRSTHPLIEGDFLYFIFCFFLKPKRPDLLGASVCDRKVQLTAVDGDCKEESKEKDKYANMNNVQRT